MQEQAGQLAQVVALFQIEAATAARMRPAARTAERALLPVAGEAY